MNPLNFRFAFLILAAVCHVHAANSLPRSSPEAQGVSSAALTEVVDALEAKIDGMHSLMVLRHGHVVAEGWWAPYAADKPHVLYSLSKSFTSTAVGMAVAEGKLSIDDEVLKFFPGDAPPEPSGNLNAMRVRDLLTMAAGHQDESPIAADAMSVKSFLAQPVPHKPGTHFKYNTPATFMQSAIVQKVTGQRVVDFLGSRLFEPLGIEEPVWDTNFQGIDLGGYGLRVRTEDIAKFGQLYLQKGQWNGRQLLPREWAEQATARQVSNGSNPKSDWDQGYGFQFWRCRHGAFRGDGAFGQFCIVMPEQDAVVAITGGMKDMQAALNVLWEKLLPAFQPKAVTADEPAWKALQNRLGKLALRTAGGSAASPLQPGILNCRFNFPENEEKIESLMLSAGEGEKSLVLTVKAAGHEYRFPCGHGAWMPGRGPFMAGRLAVFPDEAVAGSFGWDADDSCTIKLCACETPFSTTLNLKFAGATLTLNRETNVAFGPTKRPAMIGRAE